MKVLIPTYQNLQIYSLGILRVFLSTVAAARLAVVGTGAIGVFEDVLHCPDGAASILAEIK